MRTTSRIEPSVGSRDLDQPMASLPFGRSPIKAAPDPAIPQPPLRRGSSKGGDVIPKNHGNRKPSGRPGGRRGSGRRRYTVTRRSDRSFLRFSGGFTGILTNLSNTTLLTNFYCATVWHTGDVTAPTQVDRRLCWIVPTTLLNSSHLGVFCSSQLISEPE